MCYLIIFIIIKYAKFKKMWIFNFIELISFCVLEVVTFFWGSTFDVAILSNLKLNSWVPGFFEMFFRLESLLEHVHVVKQAIYLWKINYYEGTYYL